MQFEFKEDDLKVSADLQDKAILLTGRSGSGKTYFCSLLHKYCEERGISCLLINHNSGELFEQDIKHACLDKQVVIFDDADMYLTQDLVNCALDRSEILIISMKHWHNFYFGSCGFYSLNFNPETHDLVVKQERKVD